MKKGIKFTSKIWVSRQQGIGYEYNNNYINFDIKIKKGKIMRMKAQQKINE